MYPGREVSYFSLVTNLCLALAGMLLMFHCCGNWLASVSLSLLCVCSLIVVCLIQGADVERWAKTATPMSSAVAAVRSVGVGARIAAAMMRFKRAGRY